MSATTASGLHTTEAMTPPPPTSFILLSSIRWNCEKSECSFSCAVNKMSNVALSFTVVDFGNQISLLCCHLWWISEDGVISDLILFLDQYANKRIRFRLNQTGG
ncbi:unnamed protein product [Lactuca virosa]|uniref:Uncharacterized protein n=1 Tax=Lactuca virosa TaxID=75947 RepID=A0AAU9MFJ3_9ASTR|nr:unnamed protein product [Lactuca virosa]